MLAESTYLLVAVGLVLLAVAVTIWVMPSRRRARWERKRLQRKAAAQRRRLRAELRMAPVLWEQERRRAALADSQLDRLVESPEAQVGP